MAKKRENTQEAARNHQTHPYAVFWKFQPISTHPPGLEGSENGDVYIEKRCRQCFKYSYSVCDTCAHLIGRARAEVGSSSSEVRQIAILDVLRSVMHFGSLGSFIHGKDKSGPFYPFRG